jgi:hypothetical protein
MKAEYKVGDVIIVNENGVETRCRVTSVNEINATTVEYTVVPVVNKLVEW